MATYYVIARVDGSRVVGPDQHRVNLGDALERGVTYFVPLPVSDEPTDQPTGLVLHPEPSQAGLGIVDDMTLALGVDGGFRLFQLQAVPVPEAYTPSSEVGSQAIVSREFLVVAEVPTWWAYGPNGRHVTGLLEAIGGLDRTDLEHIGRRASEESRSAELSRFAALTQADQLIAESGRLGAARLARGYARAATYRAWERNSALSRAATLAGDLAHLLVVGDLVRQQTLDEFTALLQPEIRVLLPAGDEIPYGQVQDLDDKTDSADADSADADSADADSADADPAADDPAADATAGNPAAGNAHAGNPAGPADAPGNSSTLS